MAISREEAQKKLQEIKEKALYIKGIVDERVAASKKSSSSGGGSSSNKITSDSSSSRRDEDALREEIEDNLRKQEKKMQRQIEAERRALERRKEEERASINTRFDTNRTQTEFEQERETGGVSMALARGGGYLGGNIGGSQMGVLQNLDVVQDREIQNLENAREEALRAANGAYEDRDFELARESLQLARDIEQEIYNRTLEFDAKNADRNDIERERLQTAERQNTIFQAIESSGSEDPRDIFEALGGRVPIEEINSFLNGIVPDNAVGEGAYKFTGSETASLLGSGMSADDITAFNQYINENGYDDTIRSNLTAAQRAAADKIFRDIKQTTGADSPSEPLSILDLQRIEETYGVLFPLGVTAGEVTKFLRDNAGASPAELQAAVDAIFGNQKDPETGQPIGLGTTIEFTEEWFRSNFNKKELKALADTVGASKWWTYKSFDIDRMFETPEFWNELQRRVQILRDAGYSEADIKIALTSD